MIALFTASFDSYHHNNYVFSAPPQIYKTLLQSKNNKQFPVKFIRMAFFRLFLWTNLIFCVEYDGVIYLLGNSILLLHKLQLQASDVFIFGING